MSPARTEVLLNELCTELGFCLPPSVQARFVHSPPADVDGFTDAVLRAEALDSGEKIRRAVRARVARHFEAADDERGRPSASG